MPTANELMAQIMAERSQPITPAQKPADANALMSQIQTLRQQTPAAVAPQTPQTPQSAPAAATAPARATLDTRTGRPAIQQTKPAVSRREFKQSPSGKTSIDPAWAMALGGRPEYQDAWDIIAKELRNPTPYVMPETGPGGATELVAGKKKPVGAVEDFKRTGGLGGVIERTMPFSPAGAMSKSKDRAAMARLMANKYPDTEKGRKQFESDYSHARDMIHAREYEQQDRNVLANVSRGLQASIGWMGEFAATGGPVSKVKGQALRGARKVLGTTGAKRILGRLGARTAGAVARTGFMPHRVLETAYGRLNPTPIFDADGEIVLIPSEEDTATGFAKAIGQVVISNLSEESSKALGAGAKQLVKRLPGGGKFVSKFAEKIKSMVPPGKATSLFTKAGYSDFVSELGEEKVELLLNAASGVTSQPGSKAGFIERFIQEVPSGKDWLVEMGVIAVPGMTRAAAARAFDSTPTEQPDTTAVDTKPTRTRTGKVTVSKDAPVDLRTGEPIGPQKTVAMPEAPAPVKSKALRIPTEAEIAESVSAMAPEVRAQVAQSVPNRKNFPKIRRQSVRKMLVDEAKRQVEAEQSLDIATEPKNEALAATSELQNAEAVPLAVQQPPTPQEAATGVLEAVDEEVPEMSENETETEPSLESEVSKAETAILSDGNNGAAAFERLRNVQTTAAEFELTDAEYLEALKDAIKRPSAEPESTTPLDDAAEKTQAPAETDPIGKTFSYRQSAPYKNDAADYGGKIIGMAEPHKDARGKITQRYEVQHNDGRQMTVPVGDIEVGDFKPYAARKAGQDEAASDILPGVKSPEGARRTSPPVSKSQAPGGKELPHRDSPEYTALLDEYAERVESDNISMRGIQRERGKTFARRVRERLVGRREKRSREWLDAENSRRAELTPEQRAAEDKAVSDKERRRQEQDRLTQEEDDVREAEAKAERKEREKAEQVEWERLDKIRGETEDEVERLIEDAGWKVSKRHEASTGSVYYSLTRNAPTDAVDDAHLEVRVSDHKQPPDGGWLIKDTTPTAIGSVGPAGAADVDVVYASSTLADTLKTLKERLANPSHEPFSFEPSAPAESGGTDVAEPPPTPVLDPGKRIAQKTLTGEQRIVPAIPEAQMNSDAAQAEYDALRKKAMDGRTSNKKYDVIMSQLAEMRDTGDLPGQKSFLADDASKESKAEVRKPQTLRERVKAKRDRKAKQQDSELFQTKEQKDLFAPKTEAEKAKPATLKERVQAQREGKGDVAVIEPKPEIRNKMFMAEGWAWHVQNEPKPSEFSPEGTKAVSSEYYQRRIRGYHDLWRISIMENPDGTRYSLVENGRDIRGTGSGAITRMDPIPTEDLENKRSLAPIDKRAVDIFRQAEKHGLATPSTTASSETPSRETQEGLSSTGETQAKEPWEMSLVEFAKSKTSPSVAAQIAKPEQAKSFEAQYLKDMRGWIAAGKPVPADVLADYPELVKPAKPKILKARVQAKKVEPIETDAATIQEIKNSLAEGEMILSSGRSVTGRKMSQPEIDMVRRSVNKNRAQLGMPPTEVNSDRPMEQSKKDAETFSVKPSDVNRQAAEDAHRHSSFSPEKRADSEQADYVKHMTGVYDKMKALAISPEQQAVLAREMARYKEGYLKRLTALLSAKSRVASAMVTGPAKFPTARNRKRLATEDNRRNDLLDWDVKAQRSIKKQLNDARTPEQAQGEESGRLQKAVRGIVATMKAFEKGEMTGWDKALMKNSLPAKLERSAANGNVEAVRDALALLEELQSKELKKPAYTKRHKIWKMADIAEKVVETTKTGEETIAEYTGATTIRNHDADRVQIFFDGKPSEEVRKSLRGSGWRWSPRAGAWQRKLTKNAEYSAGEILAKHGLDKSATTDLGGGITLNEDTGEISEGGQVLFSAEATKSIQQAVDTGDTDPEFAKVLKRAVSYLDKFGIKYNINFDNSVYELDPMSMVHRAALRRGGVTNAEIQEAIAKGEVFQIRGLTRPSYNSKGQFERAGITFFRGHNARTAGHEVTHVLEKAGQLAGWKGTEEQHAEYLEGIILEGREGGLVEFNEKRGGAAQGQEGASFQGKPIAQTDTPEFKWWFGDSKVVDESGKPLVVYHGTRAAGFNKFKRRLGDVGIHLGTSGQANDRLDYVTRKGEMPEGTGIYPAYARIRNPLRLSDVGSWDAENLEYALIKHDAFSEDEVRRRKTRHYASWLKNLQRLIRSKGYDGIVYKNEGETSGAAEVQERQDVARKSLNESQRRRGRPLNAYDQWDMATPEYQAWNNAYKEQRAFRANNSEDSYIVFEPTQIKSATGNRGTFDPNNPDIRFQAERVPKQTAAQKREAELEQARVKLDAAKAKLEKAGQPLGTDLSDQIAALKAAQRDKADVQIPKSELAALDNASPATLRRRVADMKQYATDGMKKLSTHLKAKMDAVKEARDLLEAQIPKTVAEPEILAHLRKTPIWYSPGNTDMGTEIEDMRKGNMAATSPFFHRMKKGESLPDVISLDGIFQELSGPDMGLGVDRGMTLTDFVRHIISEAGAAKGRNSFDARVEAALEEEQREMDAAPEYAPEVGDVAEAKAAYEHAVDGMNDMRDRLVDEIKSHTRKTLTDNLTADVGAVIDTLESQQVDIRALQATMNAEESALAKQSIDHLEAKIAEIEGQMKAGPLRQRIMAAATKKGLTDAQIKEIIRKHGPSRTTKDGRILHTSRLSSIMSAPKLRRILAAVRGARPVIRISKSANTLAKKRGVDIRSIRGSGSNGSITVADIERVTRQDPLKDVEAEITAIAGRVAEVRNAKPRERGPTTWAEGFVDGMRRQGNAIISPYTLAKGLDGSDPKNMGPVEEHIHQPIIDAHWDAVERKADFADKLVAKVKELGIDAPGPIRKTKAKLFGAKHGTDLFATRRIKFKDGTSIKIDGEGMIEVYNALFDSGHKDALIGSGYLTTDQMAEIINQTPDSLKQFADWMRGEYAAILPEIKDTLWDAFGIEMGDKGGYAGPIRASSESTVTFEDLNKEDILARASVSVERSTKPSFTKRRAGSKQPPEMSAVVNFIGYMDRANHFIAFANKYKRVRAILNSPEVAGSMARADMSYLRDWLSETAGTSAHKKMGALDAMVRFLRMNAVPAALGVNLVSTAIQPVSIANAFAEFPQIAKYAAQELATMAHNPIKYHEDVSKLSVLARTRRQRWVRELRERQERSGKKVARYRITQQKTMTDYTMYLISTSDQYTVDHLWMASYRYGIDTNMGHKGATQYADKVIMTTQPTGDVVALPPIYREGEIGKMVTVFTRQMNQVINQNIRGVKATKRGNLKLWKLAASTLVGTILPGLIIGALRRGGRPPEDAREAIADATLNHVRGAGAAGWLSEAYLKQAITGDRPPFGHIQKPIAVNPLESISRAVTAKNAATRARYTAQTAAYLTGAPWNQPYRTYTGMKDLVNGDTADPRRLIWSKWALDEKKPAKPRKEKPGFSGFESEFTKGFTGFGNPEW